ncbi:MAG: isoprenylcysteine carboxylmethyltransferase family protein [Myxococcales bacterium]|nr:isoprenylcysteine carboxylmethyltransferase family protein [Myxococcales bacterium]
MKLDLYPVGLGIIALVALGRAVVVHYVFFRRTLSYRKRAVTTPAAWTDFVAYPEPALLFAVTLYLWIGHENPAHPTTLELARVFAGTAFALGALALQWWSIRAFPTVAVGHYVLSDQEIITHGPYAYVRHPIYLLVIMIWVSVAIGFASSAAAVITIAYVIPAYVIYSHSEEKMMVDHFGDAYRAYRRNTGAFFPRLRKRAPAASAP